MTVSTIPDVLNFLVKLAKDNFRDVLVTDGQPIPPQDAEPDLLCIGFTGDPEEPAVEATRSTQQAKPVPDRETYEITCLASSWKGNDTDPVAVRETCFDIVNRFAQHIYKDHTLGKRVMRSRVMTTAFAQEQTTSGAVATVRFVVQIDAFTRL